MSQLYYDSYLFPGPNTDTWHFDIVNYISNNSALVSLLFRN